MAKRAADQAAGTPTPDGVQEGWRPTTAIRVVVFALIYASIISRFGSGGGGVGDGLGQVYTAEEVDSILDKFKLLHVGGPHRGGTTLLADMLAVHARVEGFTSLGSDNHPHSHSRVLAKPTEVEGRGMRGQVWQCPHRARC